MLPGMTDHELVAAALVTLTRAGITLAMLADPLQHNHRLPVYCPSCRRRADLKLARLG
jgi:hypothetical protein